MIINWSSHFKRSYKKLPVDIKKDFIQKIKIFVNDPWDPSLKSHKLKGKLQECYSFYLRDGYRVLFEFELTNEINLLDIGPHDKYFIWSK